MKNAVLFFALSAMVAISCSKRNPVDADLETSAGNKVLLLKVDYQTTRFEEARVLDFSSHAASDFTISTSYKAPGDFGSVQLYFKELNQKIFDGTIIWMGKGAISYPDSFVPANRFSSSGSSLPYPGDDAFKTVVYDQLNTYPPSIDYARLWQAIEGLKIVAAYRQSNPDEKIHVFLYTPSVGVGNPADWDWIIILKN